MDVFTLSAKLVLDTGKFATELAQAESEAKGFGQKTATFFKGAGKVATVALSATAVAAGKFFKDAMEAGMDFDAMMSDVKAISGATGEEFDILRQRALELGASTKFTAEESAGAFHYMAMAGWDAQQMLDGVDAVLALAAASGEDLATTSDIVTDALTAFGLGADDASHFANVLAATATSANTNVGMMGETFKYVAPIAGALSIASEDMAASIGVMANQGIKASQAGTALRSLLLRIGTDTGATENKSGARGILEDMGVEFYERGAEEMEAYLNAQEEYQKFLESGTYTAEENRARQDELYQLMLKATSGTTVRDWSDFIADAREAWKGLDTQTATEYAKRIAGQYGSTGWLALMNATDAEYEKLMSTIDKADEGNGAAQDMADTMLDNLQGDITILNSALDGLKILVSDEFTGTFRKAVQEITKGISDITASIRENGLGKGIWAWLTGTNERDLIGDRLENDLNAAETNAVQAEALTMYMQGLIEQYGEAATKTEEWKAAVEDLESVMPGVSEALTAQGNTLQENLDKVIQMKDEMREMAIQQAMRKAIDAQYEYLGEQVTAKAQAEIRRDIAQTGLGTVDNQMIAMIRAYAAEELRLAQGYNADLEKAGYGDMGVRQERLDELMQMSNFTAAGQSSAELLEMAKQALTDLDLAYASYAPDETNYLWDQSAADELLAPEQLQAISDQMDEYNNNLEQANSDIEAADKEIQATEEQIRITEAALQRTAASLSGTSEGVESAGSSLVSALRNAANSLNAAAGEAHFIPHAKGAANIPYDNYPALLHRGEMVLSASQARKYRDGENGGINAHSFAQIVAGAVRESMQNVAVRSYLNGKDITDDVQRRNAARVAAGRFA